MNIAIELAVLIEAVLLTVMTFILGGCAVLLLLVCYQQWDRTTGGIASLKGSNSAGEVLKFFRRVRQKDGSFQLVPYDELEDERPDPASDEDDAAGFEDDYMDGVTPSPRRRRQ